MFNWLAGTCMAVFVLGCGAAMHRSWQEVVTLLLLGLGMVLGLRFMAGGAEFEQRDSLLRAKVDGAGAGGGSGTIEEPRKGAREPGAGLGINLWIPKFLVRWLLSYAQRRPYLHLKHDDGRVYMERFWIYKPKDEMHWGVRVHHILMADLDRHNHDHPFDFWSRVCEGWYREELPTHRGPCFEGDRETTVSIMRREGNLAFRRCVDRHTISEVSPGGVWTIVITSPLRQWWGFYTPKGKVYWPEYQTINEVDPT